MSKRVSIIMGSDSDLPVMKEAAQMLEELGIEFELTVVSAHRTPDRMYEFGKNAHKRGIQVVIAGAGGAATAEPAPFICWILPCLPEDVDSVCLSLIHI